MAWRALRERTRPPSAALLALAAALSLGVAGRIAVHAGAHVPHGGGELYALGRAAVALGAPWLAVAWAVGTLAGSPLRAALAGGAGLALGTVAWYALSTAEAGRHRTTCALPRRGPSSRSPPAPRSALPAAPTPAGHRRRGP